MPNGEWCAVIDMITTVALCRGCDEAGYTSRFCYEYRHEAEKALKEWDGEGDPPGPWIKEKGVRVERTNPEWAKGEV